MLLVIPAIDLQGEFCVRIKDGSFARERIFFDDPVKMAQLWRIQNARALHISGHDEGETCDRKILSRICAAVDIPIQLHGVFAGMNEISSALDAGVYRVILDVYDSKELTLFRDALCRFGTSRIIAGLHATAGRIGSTGAVKAIDLAAELESLGCRRIVYTDLSVDKELDDVSLDALRQLSRALGKARITAAGGIRGFNDLMKLAELESRKVDSAVIGSALYENRFPCQSFWCWNYKDEIDLSRFSTARLSSEK